MFTHSFSQVFAWFGLAPPVEPAFAPEPEFEPETTWVDIGYLDLSVPDQAFDALRKVVSVKRAQEAERRAAGRFDLAA
jgi:hypothetical protein